MLTLKGNKDGHRQKAMAKALGGGGKTQAWKQDSADLRYRKARAAGGEAPLPMIRGKTEARRQADEVAQSDEESEEDDSDWDDDDDAAFRALREKRMAALQNKMSREGEFRAMGHGQYTQLTEEDFLPAVTKSKYVVCHFFHKDFERCKVMDKHLRRLAERYLPTRFITIDAEKTPFFVQKLQVRVLPTVVMFKDGVAIDRIVGFEDLGGDGEDFTTRSLECRIANKGTIVMLDELTKKHTQEYVNSIRKGSTNATYDSDEEYDDA